MRTGLVTIGLTTLDVVARARALAERSYAFFRWATLPPFLRTYGG